MICNDALASFLPPVFMSVVYAPLQMMSENRLGDIS